MTNTFRAALLYMGVWLPISIGVAAYWWSIAPHEGFASELTTSSALWNDLNKLRDLQIVPLLLALQAMGLVFMWALSRNSEAEPRAAKFETLSRLAPVLALALAVLFGFAPALPILAVGLLTLFYYWRYVDSWHQQLTRGVVVAIGAMLIIHNAVEAPVHISLLVGMGLASLCAAPGAFGRKLLAVSYPAGVVVVCIVFCSIAPRFWLHERPFGALTILDGVFAILVLTTIILAWRKLRENKQPTPAPPIVLAMAFSLFFVREYGGVSISPDDYHFGERLVAFDALANGRGLFTTVIPSHGFANAFGGVISWAGGDVTAGGVVWGERLGYFLGRFAALTLLFSMIRGGYGLALALVFPLHHLHTYLTPFFTLLLLALNFVPSALLAGFFTAAVSAASIFFAGGIGAALAVAGAAALAAVRFLRSPRELLWFVIGGALCGALTLIVFWDQTISWANYLLISAQTNVVVYSIAEQRFPLFKHAWTDHAFMFLPSFGALISIIAIQRKLNGRSNALRAVLVILPLFVLAFLLSNYAMTRTSAHATRAVKSTHIAAIFLAPWALLMFPGRSPGLAVGASVLLLSGLYAGPSNSPYIYAINQRVNLMPQKKPVKSSRIAPRIKESLRLGAGAMSHEHRQDITAIKEVIDVLLPEGDSFANLTNRSALSFYLNRPPVEVLTSAYNSAPRAFQELTLKRWRAAPPPLALVAANNVEHDGRTLPLRSYGLYRFLIDGYEPFMIGSRVFAAPKGSGLIAHRESHFTPVRLTDKNWINGIGAGDNNWSFFLSLDDAAHINEGDRLVFSDGVERVVLRRQRVNVKVDGSPLNPTDLATHSFVIRDDPRRLSSLEVWNRAFPIRHFGKLPSAWGRSLSKLRRQIADQPQAVLSLTSVRAAQALDKENEFEITADDPQWIYHATSPIAPKGSGLLKMFVRCADSAIPAVQVFWRAQGQTFDERRSVRFLATNEENLVPLDALPSWLLSEPIIHLRIDVNNPQQCPQPILGPISLHARIDPSLGR